MGVPDAEWYANELRSMTERCSLYGERASNAEARIATLERDLAAAQAKVVALDELVARIMLDLSNNAHDICSQRHGDWYATLAAVKASQSRSPGSLSALEAMLKDAARDGWNYGCGTAEDSSTFVNTSREDVNKIQARDVEEIVSRILGKEAAR